MQWWLCISSGGNWKNSLNVRDCKVHWLWDCSPPAASEGQTGEVHCCADSQTSANIQHGDYTVHTNVNNKFSKDKKKNQCPN